MKYLIVLGIIALLFYLLLYWRFRHYIPLARRIFGLTRDLYRMTKGNAVTTETAVRSKSSEGERLVRCASCGTWIPSSRAVQLKSAASVYCSIACLENATAEPRTNRRSAKR